MTPSPFAAVVPRAASPALRASLCCSVSFHLDQHLPSLKLQIDALHVPWLCDPENLLVQFSIVHSTIVYGSLEAAEPVRKWGKAAVRRVAFPTFPQAGHLPFSIRSIPGCPTFLRLTVVSSCRQSTKCP